jgi:hypothetical protein
MTPAQRAAVERGAIADVETAVLRRRLAAFVAGIDPPPTPTVVEDEDPLDNFDL